MNKSQTCSKECGLIRQRLSSETFVRVVYQGQCISRVSSENSVCRLLSICVIYVYSVSVSVIYTYVIELIRKCTPDVSL